MIKKAALYFLIVVVINLACGCAQSQSEKGLTNQDAMASTSPYIGNSDNSESVSAALESMPKSISMKLKASNSTEIEVNASISLPNIGELYECTLRPTAIEKLPSLIATCFGKEADLVKESIDEYQYKYILINKDAPAGTLNAFATLDVFTRDQSLSFTDYRSDLNGDIINQVDAPNCNISRDQAIAMAIDYLHALGVENPVLIDAFTLKNIKEGQKGFYYMRFCPVFFNMPYAQGITSGGGSPDVRSVPVAALAISDDGVFSVNGRFLYTVVDPQKLQSILSVQGILDKVEFYLQSGLISNIAPLPIETISLEYFSSMNADGTCSLRPVWAIRADRSKMKQEWLEQGLYRINLFIYADDGTLASL